MPTRCVSLLLSLSLAGTAQASFEREPELDAAELVVPALLSGPDYSVSRIASVSGYQARFTLRTRFGEIEADSVEMLAIRVAEMPAVEILHRAEASTVLAQSAGDAAARRGSQLAQLARHPVDTLTGLPRGVARYFGKRLRQVGDRARKVSDRAWRGLAHDGSPYDDVDGVLAATRRTPDSDTPWHAKPRRELVNLAKGELNFGRARRELAQQLGIDPDTSNPLIRPRLDALAWVSVGGQQGTGLALGALGAAGTDIIASGARIHDAVWELDPTDLRARNRARISPWCTDELLMRAFLRHKAFNPALQTRMTEALRSLAPASGCDAALETTLMAANEQEARFIVNALSLLLHHLDEAAPGGELKPLGSTLMYTSSSGELLLPLAVDRLSWTRQMRDFFDGERLRMTPRTILVTGSISLRAQRELTSRGWSMVSNLPYPGAPEYDDSPLREHRVAASARQRLAALEGERPQPR